MKHLRHPKAFTLLEILIATTLIVLIISVSYGTFKAVTETTGRIKPQTDAALLHRSLTTQIARQIRGCFVNILDSLNDQYKPISTQRKPSETDIFLAKNHAADGIFLQYITTHGFYFGKDPTQNLLAVRYRFDSIQKKWLYQQQPFIPGNKIKWTDDDIVIAENIETLSVRCFDGENWQKQWDFSKARQCPSALQIEYTTLDQNGQEQIYRIVANLNTQAESKEYTTDTPDHEL